MTYHPSRLQRQIHLQRTPVRKAPISIRKAWRALRILETVAQELGIHPPPLTGWLPEALTAAHHPTLKASKHGAKNFDFVNRRTKTTVQVKGIGSFNRSGIAFHPDVYRLVVYWIFNDGYFELYNSPSSRLKSHFSDFHKDKPELVKVGLYDLMRLALERR